MPKLWTPDQSLIELEAEVIENCLVYDTRPFAGTDAEVNNHLNFGYDETPETLRSKVVYEAGKLIMATGLNFKFIIAVPTGANDWATEIGQQIDPEPTQLWFTKTHRREFKPTASTLKALEDLDEPTALIVDDATSDGGTTEAMANQAQDLGLRPLLLLSLFFRGTLPIDSKYERAVVMARHIPLMIDWEKKQSGLIAPLH